MSSEHGGKEDGGKQAGKLRRAINSAIHPGRPATDKEQPLHPQPTSAVANGSVSNPQAPPRPSKPVRSQTAEFPPVPPKHTNQTAVAQGAIEHPPLLHSSSTAGAAPNPTAAQAPTSIPPALVSAPVRSPTPTSAPPPSVTPAKRAERSDRVDRVERAERLERPGSADPHMQRTRELEQQNKALQGHCQELKEKNQNLVDRNQNLEECCRFFGSEPYRTELVSIRTHLQVNDLLEPWEISQRFQAINKAIENVSRNISEHLIDTYPPKVSCTTSDLLAFAQTPPSKPERGPADSQVPVEDFIDFCSRSLINQELVNVMFRPDLFNPALDLPTNQLLSRMYSDIRVQESQVIAGRWRISSFNVHKHNTFLSEDAALHFCQNILLKLYSDVYGDKAAENVLNKFFQEIKAVFDLAWQWYSSAKSSIVLLDFQPFCAPPGSPFEPTQVVLEGRKPKPPASGAILLTSRLGLMSSEALGKGEHPIEIIQLKATALTTEYFLSSH